MPRFNNGMPGRNGRGSGMGTGMGNGVGLGAGQGLGQERGVGGGRGRGANCRGNGQGFGFGFGAGNGQASVGQRTPGFFRRFCLGLTDPSDMTSSTRRGGHIPAIDDLQRQIDALKNSSDK